MQDGNQTANYQFLLRLNSLPIVHAALDQASVAYSHLKQTNSLLNYTLSTVEKSVLYANEKALPIVKRLETPLTSADSLACRSLDKLEQAVLIVKVPTEKILQDTRNMYSNALKSGVDRYKNVRAYGAETVLAMRRYGADKADELLASEYGKLVTGSVDDVLSLLETYVDTYLPPSDDDDLKTSAKEKPTFERLSYFRIVVQRRIRRLAAAKLRALHEYLEQLKTAPRNVYTNARWMWAELSNTPEEDTRMVVDDLAWFIAHQTTQAIVSTFNSNWEYIRTIPDHFRTEIDSGDKYTSDIHSQNGLKSETKLHIRARL